MSQVGLKPTIPVIERTKTVHALDGTATVIGPYNKYKATVDIINLKQRYCTAN
jgi:hypothetical protein